MANQLIRSALAQLVLAAMIIGASKAHAAEIKMIAGAAIREAYLELLPSFEKSSGHKVTTIWDGTENIIKRINGGEVADIVILGAPTIDKLIAEGKLVAGSRTDIVRSGIGIAVRSGLPKPDISSSEAVKNAMLAANSIAYSTGPSGIYIAELVQKMGIANQVKRANSGDTILIFQDHLHPANAAPSKPVFLKHLETRFTESALRSLDNLRFPALA